MPGRHITNRQVARYMHARQAGRTQVQAADSADICERTGRWLDHAGRAAREPRSYRTRVDPFADVWSSSIVPLLRRDAQLKAVTLLCELQRLHPGRFADGQVRTLERRVRQWRATEGPSRPVMFPQDHPPGWQALLDFTVCHELGVTIAGIALPHRLGHVCCPHSGWQYAQVILGGESYPALAETLRMALEALGGVPQTLRTDSLSAAYKNLRQQEDLTVRFEALCRHYGCSPTRNTLGVAHENGAVESPNGHLKVRIDQALRLRGDRDFATLDDYRAFVAGIVAAANAPRAEALAVERAALSPLPRFPGVTWTEALGTVSRFSLITVLGISYMVPSRLMGHRLVVRIYDDRLEFFAGRERVHSSQRLHDPLRTRLVNYRLCIEALIRKPGAFARLVYRDDLHPNRTYARTWERLRGSLGEHAACRTYVRLLHLAHRHACEAALGARLATLLDSDEMPDAEALRAEFAAPVPGALPVLHFRTADPAGYDALRCLPKPHPPQVATA
ncbi:IS21 family transposase [Ramlibacter sp.]|uniref:IS21 family transposase n=1 Tax=Ramlibacter sp. TaxID=1917967 RepID=UPI0018291404|nr:IS21 family transposase [Ramlibacter sp.]MBA2672829.1 IS21 family transposase [Ramlibacter sp.]